MINSNVPMLDDRIYRVVVHANQNSMSYAVTDTYTGQTANGWVSQTIPQTITANGEQKQVGGQTASYSTQGGMGFFKLDRDDIGRFTTTKVEYWGIQSGWF